MLTAPDERPIAFRRWRENVIVLCVDALKLEESVSAGELGVRMKRCHQRPAGEIAIHNHLEDIVMAAVFVEVPVVIVRLVETVQTIETLDPTDFDLDVEVFPVVVEATAFSGFLELVHAD
jgi:hypothetical protein